MAPLSSRRSDLPPSRCGGAALRRWQQLRRRCCSLAADRWRRRLWLLARLPLTARGRLPLSLPSLRRRHATGRRSHHTRAANLPRRVWAPHRHRKFRLCFTLRYHSQAAIISTALPLIRRLIARLSSQVRTQAIGVCGFFRDLSFSVRRARRKRDAPPFRRVSLTLAPQGSSPPAQTGAPSGKHPRSKRKVCSYPLHEAIDWTRPSAASPHSQATTAAAGASPEA